jgi:hypothetical protein
MRFAMIMVREELAGGGQAGTPAKAALVRVVAVRTALAIASSG